MNPSAVKSEKSLETVFNRGGIGVFVCERADKLGRDWWTDENYSHGLLVPFVIGFIVYRNSTD
jgi:hypothetical protein